MRRLVLSLLCCFPTLLAYAGETAQGRWEGTVQIPADGFPVVIDLAQDRAGAWTGSLIAPGLNIKGAELADITMKGTEVTFVVRKAFEDAEGGHAKFVAHLDSLDAMSGQFLQGGNSAAFVLRKTGPAQVELPVRSTPLPPALEGKWVGDYELGGYARQVTLTLTNHAGAAATAEFTVVGKKTTNVPVDLVRLDEDFLRVESSQTGISFEGRFSQAAGEIRGTFEQGPYEPALLLHRAE